MELPFMGPDHYLSVSLVVAECRLRNLVVSLVAKQRRGHTFEMRGRPRNI